MGMRQIGTLMLTLAMSTAAGAVMITSPLQEIPRVLLLENPDGAVAIWEDLAHGIWGRRLGQEGTPPSLLLNHEKVHPSITGRNTLRLNPEALLLPSGDLFLFWIENREEQSPDQPVSRTLDRRLLAQRFNENLHPVGPRLIIDPESGAWPRAPRAVLLPDGAVFVVWVRENSDRAAESTRGLFGLLVRDQLASEPWRIDEAGGSPRHPVLAVNDVGNVLVAWQRGGHHSGIRARIFSEKGAAVGEFLDLTSSTAFWPTVAATGGAGFQVAWTESTPKSNGWQLQTRTVNDSGFLAETGGAISLPERVRARWLRAEDRNFLYWLESDEDDEFILKRSSPEAQQGTTVEMSLKERSDVATAKVGERTFIAWSVRDERGAHLTMRPTATRTEPSFDVQGEPNSITETTGEEGTCWTSGCQQCRAAGYTQAHDQCVYWAILARSSHKVRFQYIGADEGHDGAANLLQRKGDGVDDICNISKGTCCVEDSGCFLGIGGCSGSSNSWACREWESCVGQFGPGGPMTGAHGGGWVELGFSGRLYGAYGSAPYDCDCTSGVSGSGGGFEIWVDSDGTLGVVTIWPPSHPPSDAGTIHSRGMAFEVESYKARTCGTFYDGLGCTAVYRQIDPVVLDYRSFSDGDPNYNIPRSCTQPPPPTETCSGWCGNGVCEPECDENGIVCPSDCIEL